MKRTIKKLSICTLFMALLSFAIFSFAIKPEASWLGPTSLKPYTQKESDMRAVWVATVGNLNIEPQIGKGDAAISRWKQNYLDILDKAEANNLNTIVFQVRPSNDAFYPSKYNPWSVYLSPDGTNPGWDPLAWMIEVTHERGMEYHAWLNPYRASTSTVAKSITSTDPVSKAANIIDYDISDYNAYKESYFKNLRELNPDIDNPALETGETLYQNVLYGTEDKFILNPASEKVQKHIENTIAEIVDNYEIDGIHFDDYFYPKTSNYKGTNGNYKGYTFSCEPSVDFADYSRYVATTEGQPLSIYDWRRENVNKLIKSLGELIRAKNEEKETKCAFGISPAARWAPSTQSCPVGSERGAEGGMSDSCNNYYSYSDLYADTYKWAKEEWIDYITPQNYTNLKGDYGKITKWWYDALAGSKTKLYIGTALYQVSSTWGDAGVSEMYFQILYNGTNNYDVDGYFIFSYDSLTTKNGAAAMNAVNKYAWKYQVLTPLYAHYTYEKKVQEESKVTSIKKDGEKIAISFSKVSGAKGYGLYKFSDDETIQFDVAHRVDVKLNNSKPFEINNEKGYKYVIVTYDQDNSIYQNYSVVNLDNKAPVVSVNLDSDKYLTGSNASLKIKVTDEDSSSFNVKIQYSDGATYQELTRTVNVNEELVVDYTLPNKVSTDGKFIITVSDELNTVVVEKSIKVVNEKPTAVFNLKSLTKGKETTFTITVNDDDKKLDYKVLISYNGTDFIYEIASDTLNLDGQGNISVTFTAQQVSSTAKIKVLLNDGVNEVEILSNAFEITEEKASSSCMTVVPVQQLMALSMILAATTIILRKKGNK